MSKAITLLAIESSCDDTAAAVIQDGLLLSHAIANQTIHEQYGGVVPELASRDHQKNIVPVVDSALKIAKVDKKSIDAIAFTQGPGLLGSLLVGSSFAKGYALGLNLPLIEVHHLQAHVLSHFITTKEDKTSKVLPKFPFLCLTVSGGHTQIVLVEDYLKMHVLGKTLDDAAGEAFDKAAKMLGLPYPGGPLIDQYAQKGDPTTYSFTLPRVLDLNYSFSGLKTAFLYFIKDSVKKDAGFIEKNINNICASIQKAIVDYLMKNLILAAKQTGIKEIAIAGGVAANSGLREALLQMKDEKRWTIHLPKKEYCTDNAAMIAIVGHYKYLAKEFVGQEVTSKARLPF